MKKENTKEMDTQALKQLLDFTNNLIIPNKSIMLKAGLLKMNNTLTPQNIGVLSNLILNEKCLREPIENEIAELGLNLTLQQYIDQYQSIYEQVHQEQQAEVV